LEILDQSMERGRCAEAFFSILTNEDALRQKVCSCACVRVCVCAKSLHFFVLDFSRFLFF
jgi:hypothetical protein